MGGNVVLDGGKYEACGWIVAVGDANGEDGKNCCCCGMVV